VRRGRNTIDEYSSGSSLVRAMILFPPSQVAANRATNLIKIIILFI